MGRLTVDERRRLFVAQQQRRQKAFAPPPTSPVASGRGKTASGRARRLQGLVKIAVIVMMLAGGSVVWRVVELHPPMSLLEALLPRA
jgi:hypothetical protein